MQTLSNHTVSDMVDVPRRKQSAPRRVAYMDCGIMVEIIYLTLHQESDNYNKYCSAFY